ncbi:MAG TPA: serine carboxypeptidase [Caldilineaceae bacterium]|nr:serine carboxypeptidase [Caldilineaceae bacterium]
MGKRILHLHLGKESASGETTVHFLGESFAIRSVGTGGDIDLIDRLIREADVDRQVDAIALDGIATHLKLGRESIKHIYADRLEAASLKTPLVTGQGVRGAFERWAIRLVNDQEPGIFTRRRVLLAPGLNHNGLADGLASFTDHRRWAEPLFYWNLPSPATGEAAFRQLAPRVLEVAHDKPYRRVFPQAGQPGQHRSSAPFEWAQIIAGDIPAIRRYAPNDLSGKTIIGECATVEDEADLRRRGVATLITTMPPIGPDGLDPSRPARWPAAVIEACLAARLGKRHASENDYLNLLAGLHWKPAVINLQAEPKVNRFAFVIHPLSARYIFNHPLLRYFRWLPHSWVERAVAYMPPLYLSRIRGIQSEATGQKVEGYLYSLGATPRQMMRHDPSFTYKRLLQIARAAEERGARIMGLGAFTSIVGDAGVTVAHHADIPITSGNSLTVAATLETAKQAVLKLGVTDLTKGNAMVVGATGSIGSVCSRLLAQALGAVTLVAPRPERLIALKQQIEAETPGAQVTIATTPDDYVAQMDVIVTTTSAFNQRVIDVTKCKPGAVICDVARPPDIEEWEAALRPDILVIESGEILLPGDPDFGFDIGLPPKTAYACLSETALLAMEGRFEDYSIGRELELEKVKEIYRLFRKHGLKLAGMRSFDRYVTDADLAAKRRLADELRADPEKFRQLQTDARRKLQEHDRRLAEQRQGLLPSSRWRMAIGGAAAIAGLFLLLIPIAGRAARGHERRRQQAQHSRSGRKDQRR